MLRKSSSIKILVLLLSFVSVIILHFYIQNKYTLKTQFINNSKKLIERNDLLLREILISTANLNKNNYSQNKEAITEAANLFEYSLSLLLTGGKTTNFETNFYVLPPNEEIKNDLRDIEKYWIEYNSQINTILKGFLPENEYNFSNIEDNYNLIKNKYKNIVSAYNFEEEKLTLISRILTLISVILYVIIVILAFLLIRNNYLKPLGSIEDLLENINEGKTEQEINTEVNNEFSSVYSKLGVLNYKISEISNFVNQLVKDNYEIRFEKYNKENVLELSLVKLRDKLKENIELNKKRSEEEKLRQWFAEGQAKFNDILRESSSGMKTLAEASLKNLVKYFNAAQGGFFIINDHENPPYLELSSAFAYDRIKALTKTIHMGEGLVGMCALERNTIWLNNVPEGYMEIESGLGEASPNNILIVPVKTDESILGVIEIASFNEFNQNEVMFIENIAEDIASTLETTKISDRTSELLEESQKKSDELAMRDSEMSEKIEELREAQKETKRGEKEMSGLIEAVDKVLYKLELSPTGRILTANNLFLNKTGFRNDELKNKNIFDIIHVHEKNEVEEILARTKNNESVQKNITIISKQDSKIKVLSLFSAIKNEADQIMRILFLGENITYKEELETKNETLLSELQYKSKVIIEKENELKKSLEKINQLPLDSDNLIQKTTEKEKAIKQKFETEIDKKYFSWINEISK